MGLFAELPEEQGSWAGLPDEPLKPRTRAEVLPDEGAPPAAPDALLGLAGPSVASIEIPIDTPSADEPSDG